MRFRLIVLSVLTAAAGMALPGLTAPSLAAGTCSGWRIVPSPKIGNENQGHFYGVSALSTSNAWAVGNGYLNGYYRTRAEHWNGTAWSIKTTPNVGTNDLEQLDSVAAISSNNVWAVGFTGPSAFESTIIEHWNGSNWKLVTSPNPGAKNRLNGIAAVSPKNLWAVGYSDGNMLILHYNGSTWSRVTVANRVGDTQDHLLAVGRVPGTSQVWAVGTGFTGAGWVTLTLRYSGGHWTVVNSPNRGSTPLLDGVAAISPTNAWAVGYDYGTSGNEALAEHWNGTKWSIKSTPNLAKSDLRAIVALSSRNLWAVGSYKPTTSTHQKTLVLHRNATTFSKVSSPNPTKSDNSFYGVARVPRRANLWAVGVSAPPASVDHPLVEKYCP